MNATTYEIIEHDGGWAYRVGATVSETFPTRERAHAAAARAAREQRLPGPSEAIAYEDAAGEWREEQVDGRDRPETKVEDR